jgi:hypothetical protein
MLRHKVFKRMHLKYIVMSLVSGTDDISHLLSLKGEVTVVPVL